MEHFCVKVRSKAITSWGNSISIVSDYRLDNGFNPQQEQRIFPSASVSRLPLGCTKPPV